MNNRLILLNAIPIFYEKTNFVLNQEEIEFIKKNNHIPSTLYNKEYTDIPGIYKQYSENPGVKISDDHFLLNNPEMLRIKNLFDKKIKNYTKEILQIENNFQMTTSWSTLNTKGDIIHDHNHTNTIFSIVYYVKCDNGNLILDTHKSSIQKGYHFNYTVKNWNIFNSSKWHVPVRTGDIIIFPGWLNHNTSKCLSDERISVAANYFIKGQIGNYKENDILEI